MVYLHMRFPGGRPKAVTLSYDDGVRQDIRLAELARTYGFRCTFNINSGLVAEAPDGGKLTWQEIRALVAAGHEAAVHGKYHLAPGSSRTLVGLRDALDCRLDMERELGTIVRGMAYPNSGITRFTGGSDYETVRTYLRETGIAYARSLGGDNNRFQLPQDWYNWIPTAHHNNPNAPAWAEEFAALNVNGEYLDNRYPRLFYLWGHSYEFDRDGGWDRIESLLQTLGGKDDTWYAANIEICDYVRAFRALIFSADGMRVFNPTVTEVCFETEQGIYTVRPGETVAL